MNQVSWMKKTEINYENDPVRTYGGWADEFHVSLFIHS